MNVSHWMTKHPVFARSGDSLASVRIKMDKGSFRRVPVVDEGKLVGIISDRDLRQHVGALEKVKINGAMSRNVVTVAPTTMLEQAAGLLIKHKIGGLPVVESGKVIGIITATDLIRAFSELLGDIQEGVSRIDLSMDGDASDLAMAVQLVAQANGEILGMGSYRNDGEVSGGRVAYLRLRSADANRVARVLTENNYKVLSIHS